MTDTSELDARADHQVGLEELERESSVLQAALVAALGDMTDIVKGGKADAGQFSYTYPTLADVLGAVRPVLKRHYLAVSQPVTTDVDAKTVTIRTRILHVAGGSYDAGRITFPLGQNAQATGSVISYGRRYALMSALGITGHDDDDGQAAVEAPTPSRVGPKVDEAGVQMRRMGALMDEAGVPKNRETRREIVGAIIGRKIKSAAETTLPERLKVNDAFEAINSGSATLEVAEDGSWRIVAVEPEGAV